MNILFLGPACPRIEERLTELGHAVHRREEPISLEYLKEYAFDFGISYRYQHILTSEMINFFGGNLINLHISLLPWNRGKDPNLWSFLEDTPKGVTIHKIDEGIDTGNILLQQELKFDIEHDTLRTAYNQLSNTIEKLFLDNIDSLIYNHIKPQKQIGEGSFHYGHAKNIYLYLIEKEWWDTPVHSLIGKARGETRERERERRLTLRTVHEADREFVFRIANDVTIRDNSFYTEQIPWETHCKWFEKKIQSGDPFYIIIYDDISCGYVRFETEHGIAVTSIALDAAFRGKHIGTHALHEACRVVMQAYPLRHIHAWVKADNIASIRLFEHNHFCQKETAQHCGTPAILFVYPGYEEEA